MDQVFVSKELRRWLLVLALIVWTPLLYLAYNNDILADRSEAAAYTRRFWNLERNHVKVVLLFAYMRGGSSFFGETFLSNPSAYYFYEPDWDVYSAMVAAPTMLFPLHTTFYRNGTFRDLSAWEVNYLTTELKKMFTCEFSRMHTESLINSWTMSSGTNKSYASCLKKAHVIGKAEAVCQKRMRSICSKFVYSALEAKCDLYMERAHRQDNRMEGLEAFPPLRNYTDCISKLRVGVDKCLPLRTESCRQSKIRTAKILRMRMRYVENIIKVLPNTKIIHQLRDPRGTVTSRRHSSRQLYKDLAKEAGLLCRKMAQDIRERHELEAKYPGVFLQTRYEDLADRPQDILHQIYAHIGEDVPEAVLEHMTNITHTKQTGFSAFKTSRSNSSRTARAWSSRLSGETKRKLDEACAEYLEDIGYEL